VLGHLGPKDLLHLFKVNKEWRQLLEDSGSKSVWIAARANLNVPSPLKWFTEVWWAKLIFKTECEVRPVLTTYSHHFTKS